MQPSEGRAPLAPSLTEACPPLEALSGTTGAEVLKKMIEVSEQYYDCADKHKRLTEAVK